MGPIRHLRRGMTAAYQNIGIGIVFCLLSLFGASATVGFVLPITESWGALFMAAVLAGKKADWDTFQAVLSRRTVDVLVFGLIGLVLLMLVSVLSIVLVLIPAVGLPLLLGSIGTGETGFAAGAAIAGAAELFFLVLFAIALRIFLGLSFTPHILQQTDLSFNDAMKQSRRMTRDYGLVKIFFSMLLAWIYGSLGLLLCGIGVLLTWPVVYGVMGSLYQDAHSNAPQGLLEEPSSVSL